MKIIGSDQKSIPEICVWISCQAFREPWKHRHKQARATTRPPARPPARTRGHGGGIGQRQLDSMSKRYVGSDEQYIWHAQRTRFCSCIDEMKVHLRYSSALRKSPTMVPT